MKDKPTYEELEQRVKELEKAESKRIQAESELKRNQELLSEMTSKIPGVLIQFYSRPDGKIGLYYVSDSSEELFGLKADRDGFFERFTELVIPEYRKDLLASVQKATEKVVQWTFEGVLQKPTGDRIRFAGYSTPSIRDTEIVFNGIILDITERKRTEEILHQKHELLKITESMANIGSWEWDVHNDRAYWSEELFRIFGRDPAEGAPPFAKQSKLYGTGDIERLREGVETCIKHGTPYEIEVRAIRSDGEIRHCVSRGQPQYDENGKVFRLVGSFQDITERKQTEVEIRKNANFLTSMLEAIPTPVFYKDIKGRYLGCNRAFTKIMGVTSSEIHGKTVQELWPSEHAEVYHQKDLELMQSPQHQRYAFEVKDKEGHSRPVLFAKDVFRDENGNVAGLLGAFLDITELKQAEDALRSSHERFLTVLDSIDATIYVADMETYEILFMNKYMKESFGSDLIGEICWAVFRNESTPCQHCTNDQLLDSNGEPAGVCVWQGKNPITGKWYLNHDRAIKWIDDRIVRIQIATDITELKNIELERKRFEEKLTQVQKMEALGTLSGGVAHDFNNLLMGIQGNVSLMATSADLSNSNRVHLKAIEDHIRSAADLTQKLLGLSRGGKYDVKPIDINSLLTECASMFGRARKEITIHSELSNPLPVVEADKQQIEQVLLNLFVNAWQAMPHGGRIYITSSIVELDESFCKPYSGKPGRYARVTVRDTGMGMDDATRRRIFDPFFTTKEKERGTGLGLASAYGIVKNHNGIITVQSEVGKGATFNIYLPLSDLKASKEANENKQLMKGYETILLVDDEKMILEVGQAMLEKLGYKTLVARNGQAAVKLFQQQVDRIDLVIVDLIMPEMDGGQLFDRIRQMHATIPILLSSGYAINGKATEIIDKGCNGFIQKPFDLSELSQKIRKIMDNIETAR